MKQEATEVPSGRSRRAFTTGVTGKAAMQRLVYGEVKAMGLHARRLRLGGPAAMRTSKNVIGRERVRRHRLADE